jgi:hypothetical protein
MERMDRLCKESLWIRSELSENCFHSVVKIILINYAKKTKLIHAWAGGKAHFHSSLLIITLSQTFSGPV